MSTPCALKKSRGSDWFEEYLIKRNHNKFQTMELWSIEAIKQVVKSGMGFAALPISKVRNEVANKEVKVISYSGELEPLFSQMLIKKKKWLNPIVQNFSEIVLKKGRNNE